MAVEIFDNSGQTVNGMKCRDRDNGISGLGDLSNCESEIRVKRVSTNQNEVKSNKYGQVEGQDQAKNHDQPGKQEQAGSGNRAEYDGLQESQQRSESQRRSGSRNRTASQGKTKLVRDERERIYVAKPIPEWTDHRVASILSYLQASEFPRCLGWCGPAEDLPLELDAYNSLSEILVSPTPRVGSYLMEYIEGKSLSELRGEDLSAETVMEWILHLQSSLQGFSTLLQKPILHLDIKPGNIIVSPSNNPSLIDFDCAMILDDFAEQWVEVKRATAAYSAPEVQTGKPHINSDLFSLARTAISVLAGKPYLDLSEKEIEVALSKLDAKNRNLLLRWQNSTPDLRVKRQVSGVVLGAGLTNEEAMNTADMADTEDATGAVIRLQHAEKADNYCRENGGLCEQAQTESQSSQVKENESLPQTLSEDSMLQMQPDSSSLQGYPANSAQQKLLNNQVSPPESDESLLNKTPENSVLQQQTENTNPQNQLGSSVLQLPSVPLPGFDQSKPVSIHLEYKLTVSPLAVEDQSGQ